MTRTDDEVEEDKERAADDPDWRERFRPGTLGCHETLYLSHVFADQIDGRLVSHPAVLLNAQWFALASRAVDALADLYQAIGREHV